jgi:hypothetical protein
MARSRGGAFPLTIVRVTTLPCGPRTVARVASTVWPSTVLPSTAVIRSPASRPALSAGAPGTGLTTMRKHVGPSGVQPSVPSGDCESMVAPMPWICPFRPWSEFVKSSGLR